MGCKGCGRSNSGRCNLCGDGSTKWYPWGKSRKICWRCLKKQKDLIIQRKLDIDRAETLLDGREWDRVKAEKEFGK